MPLKDYALALLIARASWNADYDITCLVSEGLEIMFISPVEKVLSDFLLVL